LFIDYNILVANYLALVKVCKVFEIKNYSGEINNLDGRKSNGLKINKVIFGNAIINSNLRFDL